LAWNARRHFCGDVFGNSFCGGIHNIEWWRFIQISRAKWTKNIVEARFEGVKIARQTVLVQRCGADDDFDLPIVAMDRFTLATNHNCVRGRKYPPYLEFKHNLSIAIGLQFPEWAQND
jgi:hypothetical protein